MGGAKPPETGQQPFRGKGRQHRRAQHARGIVLMQAPRRLDQAIEGGADVGKIGLGGVGQQQTAADAAEQLEPQPLLEAADLMADRRLGDVELGRRRGEAEMPGGGLEGAQRVEGRKLTTHN